MSDLRENFLQQNQISLDDMEANSINWEILKDIYTDFIKYNNVYENQADFIASTLRTHSRIHSVKSRVKDSRRLIQKLVRKTADRQAKYGKDFQFTVDNYKDEINDLIGVRALHIFKDDWEDIHNFICKTWNIIEITANVRDGDNTKRFEELGIQIHSRKSGYRSVHYLIEFFPTNQKVIAEIQVRTIFEEGYGEIDHQLRYSHKEIPDVLALNLLLFNRIAGCSDEMASFINMLNRNWTSMEQQHKETLLSKTNALDEVKALIHNKDELSSISKEELIAKLNNLLER